MATASSEATSWSSSSPAVAGCAASTGGPGRPASLAGLDVEIARGDVRDPAALAAALVGVDEVYHLAALTRSRTRREMLATNVDGTRRLLAAAPRAGLPGRFCFCSQPGRGGAGLRQGDR